MYYILFLHKYRLHRRKLPLFATYYTYSCLILNSLSCFSVSGLGEQVLSDPGLRNDVMLTCLHGLRWPDSPSGVKAAGLVELILPR